jgi:hypothetical protein
LSRGQHLSFSCAIDLRRHAAGKVPPASFIPELLPFPGSKSDSPILSSRERIWPNDYINTLFVVPPLEASALAHTRERALIKALKKIFASTELWNLNAVEIARVKTAGLWTAYWASIEADARHIGQKPILSDEQQPGRFEIAAAVA